MNNRGLLFFSMGCAAAMAAGILLSSKAGREAVEYLRSKADDGTQTLKEGVDKLSDAVTTAATRGLKTVKYQKENVEAALEAGKKTYKTAQEMTP
jgi:X-X-X-Leu-X-X-Gly heptad repeat protein